MTAINVLDAVACLAALFAVAALARGWFRLATPTIRPVLMGLCVLTLFQSLFLLLEWLGLGERFDQLEDFVGALIPMWWGFVFYAFVQHENTRDLRQSEERMELALRGADLGTWDWEIAAGKVVFNRRWAEMLGYRLDELDQSVATWEQLLHPEDRPEVTRTLEKHLAGQSDLYETEHRLRHKAGHWIWVLDKGRVIERDRDGRPLRACGTHLDITARKQMEAESRALQDQLLQSQKMESVGRLAGGVAHDLNNLLTPILGYGEMLQQGLADDDGHRQSVDEMLRAGHRARDLVRQLLAFSRKQILNVQPVDLGQVVGEFENLLRQTLPDSVTLAIVPVDGPRLVLADAGQLEQVLLNLAVNAAHAMPDGGTLTVESSLVELGGDQDPTGSDLAPGPYVRLAISDTGTGMTPDVVEKIFEPFFTTKGEHGTGLGLAMAYGIVRQHGGGIRVDSEPDRGTTFVIHLPATAAPVQAMDIPRLAPGPPPSSGTVLVVEDDEQVGQLARTILERGGFTVLLVHDGAAALDLLATHEGSIDLLLTDVIMPGLNGKELYEQAVRHRPDLAVLYMSGYTDSIIADRGFLDGAVHFIQKPFSAKDLIARVLDVLGS